MQSEIEKLATSRQVGAKVIPVILTILKEAGGSLSGREVMNIIRERVTFNEWELSKYEKTGYVRWESITSFDSINLTKAGFIRKQKGIWYLTKEGEQAQKLKPVELLKRIDALYKAWSANQKKGADSGELDDTIDTGIIQKANLDQLESQAKEGIKEFVNKKNPYEFQDMIAALLRAMGYYTPFIAPKGPDGGVDIVAYQDPLGTKTPRIKVQVKHRPGTSIPVGDIKNLLGSLSVSGDVGLFVTSGKFTSEAEKFARSSHIHVKLIDFDNLIDLWQEFYPKFADEEKNFLPLYPIYFLGSNE